MEIESIKNVMNKKNKKADNNKGEIRCEWPVRTEYLACKNGVPGL